jgi:SAM-dependent methyltransferase
MEQLEALLRCPQCGSEIRLGDVARCAQGHDYLVVDGVPVFLDEDTIGADPQYSGQRAYFDAEFSAYTHYALESWRKAYLDRLRTANLLEGSSPLVDVGVGGSGYTVIEAARTGRPAIGCDLSLAGLLAAREFARAEGVGERTSWICCSAEQLPLASGAFGSALAIAVLEHVPDDRAALKELARVLKPGGRAWLTVPHALRHVPRLLRGVNRRHDRRLGHLRRYEADDLRTPGLEVVEIQYTGHAVKLLQVAAPWAGERLWWWGERRDLRRKDVRRGSMQLSVVFERTA